MMLRRGIVPLVALVVVTLSGCGGSSAPTTTASVAPASAASTSLSQAVKGLAKFGETLSKDGVSVTVGAPTAFTPSSSAVAGSKLGAGPSTLFQVTVKNDSDRALNPFGVSLKATSGDVQVEQVHDAENGILPPTADILPGKSLTWKAAFDVPPGKSMDLQVSVNFTSLGVYSK